MTIPELLRDLHAQREASRQYAVMGRLLRADAKQLALDGWDDKWVHEVTRFAWIAERGRRGRTHESEAAVNDVVERIATTIPVTQATLDDSTAFGGMVHAALEYSFSDASKAPLTAKERVTGLRIYLASNGFTHYARVGWRELMYRALEAIRRERYPDDYREPYE